MPVVFPFPFHIFYFLAFRSKTLLYNGIMGIYIRGGNRALAPLSAF